MASAQWDQVLKAAEFLQKFQFEDVNFQEIHDLLLELEESFPKHLDPIEQYPDYCFRQFCKALDEIVFKLSSN